MHNALWERNLNGFGFKTLVYFFAYFEGGFPLVVDRSYPADDGKIERRVPQLSELYFRRRFVDRMPMPYTSHLVPSPRMTRSPRLSAGISSSSNVDSVCEAMVLPYHSVRLEIR